MKSTFISWLPHCRRSDALADALAGKSHLVHYLGFKRSWQAIIKYPMQAFETLRLLHIERPDLILVATPPVVAALVIYIYARLRKIPFVIDAHTGTFDDPRWTWLLPLSRWLSRAATATIITNEHLAQIVRSWGARAVIIGTLPMKFPIGQLRSAGDLINIVFINTFSRDEPIAEVLSVANNKPHIRFQITGDLRRASQNLLEAAPANVHFTGWLSDDEYVGVLRNATVVMVLTTRDHTMQRGAYEAMAVEKPLITSDWPLLRETFCKGTIHVANTVDAIAAGIDAAIRRSESLSLEMKLLRQERSREFEHKLTSLRVIIKNHPYFSLRSGKEKELPQV